MKTNHTQSAGNRRAFDEASAIQRTPVQYEKPRLPAVVACQPPDSEIQSLMNSQESGLIQLHDAISRLRERLGPILIPSPCAEPGNGVLTPTGSDLGRGLNTHNGRIYDSVASINTIINELAI